MRNLTMMTDLYQLTMMYGYYKHGRMDRTAVFDLFFRKQANGSAYAVAAGLEQAGEYIENLHFDDEDIAYLRSLGLFDEGFLQVLSQVRFTGEVVGNNGKRVAVQMEFLTSKQAYPVAFRMLEKKGRWVVYDVLIEGISMIKNYRDQFRDILSKGDPQTLIDRVQAKALEQKEKKKAEKKEAK